MDCSTISIDQCSDPQQQSIVIALGQWIRSIDQSIEFLLFMSWSHSAKVGFRRKSTVVQTDPPHGSIARDDPSPASFVSPQIDPGAKLAG
jgi:hypothetical protein